MTTTGRGAALGGHGAAAFLDPALGTVRPRLRSAVASLPGPVRRVAMYHFGWENADGSPATGADGEAVRPALVLAAARALGGDPYAAVPAAAAVELAHNVTLLHDGIVDEGPTGGGRPTARTVFGIPAALLAGDALLALALRLLAEDGHPAAPAASARLAACVIELCAGRQADRAAGARGPQEVSLDECLATAAAGTALLGCACAVGALYAGAGEAEVAALDAFGREAGLAFRLIDDLIGLFGDPDRPGRPVGADPAARGTSLPVAAALASGAAAGAELAALHERPVLDAAGERRAADAVERAGGRDWAQAQAADRMGWAVQQLAQAVPEPSAAGDLLALAEFMTRRTR
ncbi:polyprenyl synthetase family protein [Streptomyces sp. NPDC051310]|uniref:polyprenyl synthetase family protein n=1 Tax=Streptomyces sp. NPDC051310 TaxID=3365649 RepID=UPI0037A31AAC